MRPLIIVIGNEKGGGGKSTVALHVAVGLVGTGRRVGCLDLDLRQRTLGRYLENRSNYAATHGIGLTMPSRVPWRPTQSNPEAALAYTLDDQVGKFDAVVIDTPGVDNPRVRAAHSFADVLVTPLNDSFIDLDLLARINPDNRQINGPGQYAEMVWEQKKRRAMRDSGSIKWVVLRNRLSALDARNKREMERLLAELSGRIGFQLNPGLGERVIFRELFHDGLTVMDMERINGEGLTLSQLAARQEVRTMIESVIAQPHPARRATPTPPGSLVRPGPRG